MHTMTNAQIEKHLAPRMGRYVGTRKGGGLLVDDDLG